MEQMRERVARALCELRIRDVRRFDTSADELEAMLPGAVDYAWQDFLPQADAALSLMQPEIDRRVAEEKAKLLERLRNLPNEMAGSIAKKHFFSFEVAKLIGRDLATAFEKEQQP